MDQLAEIISKILDALRLPGEEYTDGECMELVVDVLTSYGYEVFPEGHHLPGYIGSYAREKL